MVDQLDAAEKDARLIRGIGPWQATALNVTMIVGAGVFVTIPLMLGVLPGPYALLGWVAAGALILCDGLIWSELGAAFPGSGGSYRYLLECYGRDRWGRLFAFLFIWQFLVSGPLELGSGLVAIAQFSPYITPEFQEFNERYTWKWVLWPDQNLSMAFGPSRALAFFFGLAIVVFLYRNITTLGRLTVTIWVGVMAAIAWILVEGWIRFDPGIAFDFSGDAASAPDGFAGKLGGVMILALYSYLGYYNVCYIGEEVRDPGRTIPRAIVLSSVIVCFLFVGLHLAMLGTVHWSEATSVSGSLPAEFMRRIHGPWAATLITVLLVWCCFGSVFAGLLGYSRIPFGAARHGHFFSAFAKVHPRERIPHISLLLVGGLMLFWTFFDLQNIIDALIVTRILEQFVGQGVGLLLLRRYQPDRPRPFRMWLYPFPVLLALAGWVYVYASARIFYIGLGMSLLVAGVVVFLLWSKYTARWPFGPALPAVGPIEE